MDTDKNGFTRIESVKSAPSAFRFSSLSLSACRVAYIEKNQYNEQKKRAATRYPRVTAANAPSHVCK